MFKLLIWCVAEIKKLWAQLGALQGTVGVLSSLVQNIIINGGGGGGSGAQQVFTNNGDPNGFVTVATTLPCICLDPISSEIWWKTDGIISNTGWY